MTPPALPEGERRQLELVVAAVREALGDDVLGVYLFGSAVMGGLRPRSDLDVLAVARRLLADGEKRLLVDRLLALSAQPTRAGRSRHVELTVVVEGEIRPWRYPPRLDLQYGDWWRAEFERGELAPWGDGPSPDLAVLLALARAAGVALTGPPPAEALEPVPRADVVRASLAGSDGLLAELEEDTRNVVLTLARVWSTVAGRSLLPKDEAAEWALARLPPEHRAVLARARAIYLGEEGERWDDLRPRLHPFAAHVLTEVRRLQEQVMHDRSTLPAEPGGEPRAGR